jgi:alkyl hydroperoxide reductase subunit AhpC
MMELGQLEKRHEEFARRHTRVIVASVEGTDAAAQTQLDFPHLIVLADKGRGLSEAADLIHPHSAPDGSDTAAPTTFLVDRRGIVRWLYRTPEVIARLSPDDLLREMDAHLTASP